MLAGRPKAGEFDDGVGTEVQSSLEGKGDEIEVARGDVFAELTGLDGWEAGEIVEELRGEEMDLHAVGRGGIAPHKVAVTNGRAAVGVAFDSLTGEQAKEGLGMLGEGVGGAAVNGKDEGSGHESCC